jgi:hypothetical protein
VAAPMAEQRQELVRALWREEGARFLNETRTEKNVSQASPIAVALRDSPLPPAETKTH